MTEQTRIKRIEPDWRMRTDIEVSQRAFMQAVDRQVSGDGELSDFKVIEAKETAFERRITWAVVFVILALAAVTTYAMRT